MRAIFLQPTLGVGGAERWVQVTLPVLERHGVTSVAVCIGEGGAFFDPLREVGVQAVSLDLGKRQALRALRQIVRLIRSFRADVIVCRGYNAEALGRIAARLTGIASVIHIQNCDDIVPHGRARRLGNRLLGRRTARYMAVARAAVPYAVETYFADAGRVDVVYNGVEPDDFTPFAGRHPGVAAEFGLVADDLVVGILARLRPEKDHALFLRAARIVADREPRARFLVVGEGECREPLERLSAELGLTDRVTFTGNRSDVGDVLRCLDVSVISSYTVECCPLAVLEAMATGIPIVSTAVGGLPEIVDDPVTGRIVPMHDHEALAGALLDVLADDERRAAMGAAGRARLQERFSVEASAVAAAASLARAVGAAPERRAAPARAAEGA